MLSGDSDPYGIKNSPIGNGAGQPMPPQGGEAGGDEQHGDGPIRSGKPWSEMTPAERIREIRGWTPKTNTGLLPQTYQRKT